MLLKAAIASLVGLGSFIAASAPSIDSMTLTLSVEGQSRPSSLEFTKVDLKSAQVNERTVGGQATGTYTGSARNPVTITFTLAPMPDDQAQSYMTLLSKGRAIPQFRAVQQSAPDPDRTSVTQFRGSSALVGGLKFSGPSTARVGSLSLTCQRVDMTKTVNGPPSL